MLADLELPTLSKDMKLVVLKKRPKKRRLCDIYFSGKFGQTSNELFFDKKFSDQKKVVKNCDIGDNRI